jgi:DNA-binding NarL/FixJ family response regulator
MAPRPFRLTIGQGQVLRAFLLDGADNATIARRCGIKPDTAKGHMREVLKTAGVSNRAALALAVERGELVPVVPIRHQSPVVKVLDLAA